MAAPIRPKDLPSGSPTDTASIPFDTGTVVQRSTPSAIINAATPLASQAEAEAGINNVNRMTALRTKQAAQAQVLTPLATASGGSGADLVATIQAGTGAIARTMLAKSREVASIDDFGGADASAKLTSALAAKRNILVAAGQTYAVKDVPLSNSNSICGNGAILNGASGGTHVVILSDYNPCLSRLYMANTDMLSGAAILVQESRFASIDNVIAPNAQNGFIDFNVDDPTTQSAARTIVSNSRAETIKGTAVKIGASVNDTMWTNVEMFGAYGTGTGGYKPWPGSIGWDQTTTPVNGLAVGGHLVSNLTLINFDEGMKLFDAQLSKYSNIIIDATSDWGLSILGASQYIDFADLFVGTSRGIRIGGTSIVSINGLRTLFTGVVPPGGGSDFFDGTAYDMKLEDTAIVRVSNWTGTKKVSVASTAKLIVLDGQTLNARSIAAITSGTTTYLSEWGGSSGEESNIWRAPSPGRILRIQPTAIAAPGSGQSFTYTVRKNFVDTSFSAALSGASAFGGADVWEANGGISVSTGDAISLKLVTSVGATSTFHQCPIQFVPD